MSELKQTKTLRIKEKAVSEVLRGKEIREVAEECHVHPRTLRRWIKRYEEGGIASLAKKPYTGSNRCISERLEKRIAHLKEREPSISLKKAQNLLAIEGIHLSGKTIWKVWKKYGLTGHEKEKMYLNIISPVTPTKELEEKLEAIDALIEREDMEHACLLANQLPFFPLFHPVRDKTPAYTLLHRLPYEKLSLKRRLDWLYPKFGRIAHTEYRDKAHQLRNGLKRRGYRYSALVAGILEVIALGWTGEMKRQLSLIEVLKGELGEMKAPHWRYILYLSEGVNYAKQLRLREANRCLRKLKQLVRFLPPEYLGDLIPLLSALWKYGEATEIGEKCLSLHLGEKRKEIIRVYLSHLYCMNGEYSKALKALRGLKLSYQGLHSRILLIRGQASLCQGYVAKAMRFGLKAIEEAERGEIRNQFHNATFLLACCYQAINHESEAKRYLQLAIPSIRKMGNLKDLFLREFLLDRDPSFSKVLRHPVIRLAMLLKRASLDEDHIFYYDSAHRYAKKHKILGVFYRLSLFYPRSVKGCLTSGKPPRLPSAFMELPVFKGASPVFRVEFLGSLRVWKGKKLLKGPLNSNERSFLIFLSFHQGKRVPLKRICENYWKESENPSRNLSRMLTQVRRFLRIPRIFLKRRGEMLEVNVYFATDYQSFLERIARARVFEMTEERSKALSEIKEALSLVRGKPFEKMYDNFAEDTRTRILLEIDSASNKLKELQAGVRS